MIVLVLLSTFAYNCPEKDRFSVTFSLLEGHYDILKLTGYEKVFAVTADNCTWVLGGQDAVQEFTMNLWDKKQGTRSQKLFYNNYLFSISLTGALNQDEIDTGGKG